MTFTCNNNAGSALQGAKVYCRNTTKKTESEEATTNASGQAIIDLADLPLADGQTLEYEDGDVILLIAHNNVTHEHDAARYVVTGASKAQTLQMNPVPYSGGQPIKRITKVRIAAMLGANTTATVTFAKVYAIGDGELLAHLEVPPNDSRSHHFGDNSRGADKGFVVERENVGLVVTATTR